MHYANGRPAFNGDRVIRVGPPNSYTKPVVGILCDAVPGNDACNGSLAAPVSDLGYCNLAECLHVDDVKALLGDITQVPDSSAPAARQEPQPVADTQPLDLGEIANTGTPADPTPGTSTGEPVDISGIGAAPMVTGDPTP